MKAPSLVRRMLFSRNQHVKIVSGIIGNSILDPLLFHRSAACYRDGIPPSPPSGSAHNSYDPPCRTAQSTSSPAFPAHRTSSSDRHRTVYSLPQNQGQETPLPIESYQALSLPIFSLAASCAARTRGYLVGLDVRYG